MESLFSSYVVTDSLDCFPEFYVLFPFFYFLNFCHEKSLSSSNFSKVFYTQREIAKQTN